MASATITYTCTVNNRSVIENHSTGKAARKRAAELSIRGLAKDIRIIQHP